MSDEPAVRGERFSGGPARSFLSSLAGDERIFAADLAVDRAHVVMLAEQGVLTDETAGEILRALDRVESAGHGALPAGEDVHEAIESAVIERVGTAGGRMHTARSRNDEVATCLRHRLREDLLATAETTLAARDALVGLAERHAETVLPGYTHLQPAQPTTVGHWACSYATRMTRDTDRLLAAFDRTNRSPLGAAAFAGTTFDVDRERTAALLGFDGVVVNAADAVGSRDFLLETASAVATAAVGCSGLAADLLVFANRGFWTPADAYASTSSIMPQKVNPDSLELVRATTGDAVGGLMGLLTTCKGLPRAYNRDLQRADPHVWDAIDAVQEAIEVAAGAVETGTWDETAAAGAAGEGFTTATGVAELLAAAGVPFRSAHEAVAAAAESVEAALAADDTAGGLDALDEALHETFGESATAVVGRDALRKALDPAASVAARDSTGGPAPDEVRAVAESARESIHADRDRLTERRERLAAAETALEQEVAEYV